MSKNVKFCSIFVLLLILITLAALILWCVLLPEDVKDTLGMLRRRRNMESETEHPPRWLEELVQTNSNKTVERKGENVLINALGQLGISGPENIMAMITLDSPCKKLKLHSKAFERHHEDVPDSNLYVRLFNAIKKFSSIYCGRDERFRKLFAKWQEVLLGLHEQFVDCDGQPDWFENTNTTIVCASAENIMNCYGESLRVEIGDVEAKAWKWIITHVVNELTVKPCKFAAQNVLLNSDEVFGSSSARPKLGALLLLLACMLASIF